MDAAAEHGAEGAADPGRRQALRRHRPGQVLHRPPARRPRRDPEPGGAAQQRGQLLRVGGHARADPRRRRRLARPHLLRVERRDLRHRPAPGQAGHRVRRRRAGPGRRRRSGAPAGLAHRAGADARPDGEAPGPAVRRQGTVPQGGDRRDVDARRAQGDRRQQQRHGRVRPGRTGRLDHRHRRHSDGQRAGARRAPAAVEGRLRFVRRRRGAAGVGEHHRRASWP